MLETKILGVIIDTNKTPCAAWQKHSHPINVVPSPKIRVPKELPLDKEGKVTCSTCHQTFSDIDKGLEKDIQAEYSGRIYLRTKNENSSMCISCHTAQLETTLDTKASTFQMIMETKFTPQKHRKKKGVKISFNHPVGVPIKTRLPKIIYESGAKFGTRKETIICETCHKMHGTSDRRLLVLPGTQSLLCGICHARSYARGRREANRKSTHPVNIIPGRTIIPESILKLGGTLGRNGEIQCRTCHRAHRAATQKSLLIKENKKSVLCFECHQGIKESIENTKHDLVMTFPELTNKKGQTAQESGLCKVCHLAHNGTGSTMWARKIGQRREAISDLCTTCHNKGKCAENKTVGRKTHPVGVRIDSRYTATYSGRRLPLFTSNGIRQNNANVTCATCHNVHKWNPETKERTFNKTVDGDNTNSFLREANSGSRLCTTCHRLKQAITDTPHDPLLEMYRKGKIPAFNVIKSSLPSKNQPGVCSKCHSPHNAAEIFLWNRKTGKGPDRISRICNGCHQKDHIAQKKNIGEFTHPINLAVDTINRFLRIPLPLFNRNYRKDPEGVILCNTCHDIHQWDPENQNNKNPQLIDGNGKNSFLRISAVSPDRDLCTTCHLKKQWVKKTDHDLSLSAPEEKNKNQYTAGQSGSCSSCHGVHNAISDFVLWGKELGQGGDRITKICNGCHSEGKSAGNKQTGKFSHPVAVSSFSVLKSLKDTSLNIYNDNYQIISPEEEKIPQLFIKNRTSPEKIDSIKKYYRMLFIRLYNLSKELPEINGQIQELLYGINAEVEKINQVKEKKDQLKKEVENSESLFKRIEFNINVLEIKSKLGVRPTRSFVQEDSIDAKLRLNRKAYKDEKKHLYALYKKKKKGKKELSAAIRKLQKLKLKAVKLKKKYIVRAEVFKGVRDKVQQLIRRLRGRNKKLFQQLETDSKDALKNERKTLSTMDKEELLLHYSDFRDKYFELLNQIKLIKDKMDAEEKERIKNEKKILSHEEKKETLRKAALRRKRRSLKAILAAKREKFERNYRKLDLDFQIASKYEESEDFYAELEFEFQGKIYCNTCHDVHQWDPSIKDVGPGKPIEGDNSNSFLRIANHEDSRLCRECHKEKVLIKGTEHDLRISAPDSKNSFNQVPSTSGLCGPCHATHNASRRSKLWARKVDEKDKKSDLISLYCASCHTKGNCAENKPFGQNSHPLGVAIKSLKEWKQEETSAFVEGEEGTVPKSFFKDREIFFKLLEHKILINIEDKPDRVYFNYTIEDEFQLIERLENIGLKGKTDPVMAAWEEANKGIKKEFSDEQTYEDVEIKQVSVLPLYTKRGYRDDQDGKIYCSTCHDVHQWDPNSPHPGAGIRLEGGADNSFLRETNNADSVLCTKCHLRQKWVIGTDHDMRISAPDLKNSQQKLTTQTGICSACHVVHNATTTFQLWARALGPDKTGYWNRKLVSQENLQVGLCTSCHATKGPVPQNLPISGLHNDNLAIPQRLVAELVKQPKYPYFEYAFIGPNQLLGISEIYRNLVEPRFTLYTPEGKPSLKGNIVCPTCHNPHIWSGNQEQPGKKQRGTLASSFLKPGVAKYFCSDCHGVDAIYLYSFFHNPRTAKQRKMAVSKKTPHRRKAGKVSVPITQCPKCHQGQEPKHNKHPVEVTVLDHQRKEKKGFQMPDNLRKVPLPGGRIVCKTCHEPNAAQVNKSYNPNFLRGEFYTAAWQRRFKSRLLSSIRGRGKLRTSSDFSYTLGTSYAPTAEIDHMLEQHKQRKKQKRKFINQQYNQLKKKPGIKRRKRLRRQPKITIPRSTGKPGKGGQSTRSRGSRGRSRSGKTPANLFSPNFGEGFSYLKPAELLKGIAGIWRELRDFFFPLSHNLSPNQILMSATYFPRIFSPEFPLDKILFPTKHQLITRFFRYLFSSAGRPGLRTQAYPSSRRQNRTISPSNPNKREDIPSPLKLNKRKNTFKPLNLNKRRSNKRKRRTPPRRRTSKFSTPYSANYRKGKTEGKVPQKSDPAPGTKKGDKSSKPTSAAEEKKKTNQKAEDSRQAVQKKKKRRKRRIKDESLDMGMGMGGFSLKTGRISTVTKEEGQQAGPRRNKIPKINEELLKLRRARLLARRKLMSESKKFFKKRKKGYFISGVVTKWSSSQTDKLGPNRYTLCYECHLMEEYFQFSPHKRQINQDFSINPEMCMYCHLKVPKRDSIEEIDFKLRISMEKQCLSCHPGLDMYHPGGIQHYGQKISKEIRNRMDNLLSQGTIYLPTKSNRLVCPSCHNPHEKGVNTHKLSKRGADEKGRLRLFGYEVCNACHKDSITPGGQAGSPF